MSGMRSAAGRAEQEAAAEEEEEGAGKAGAVLFQSMIVSCTHESTHAGTRQLHLDLGAVALQNWP